MGDSSIESGRGTANLVRQVPSTKRGQGFETSFIGKLIRSRIGVEGRRIEFAMSNRPVGALILEIVENCDRIEVESVDPIEVESVDPKYVI